MEMSRDELQSWIRDQVMQNELISPDLLEKCNLLDSLLERRKKQVADLVELSESVAAYEETVKKLYSLLGWEYSDTDSDSDEDDDDSRSKTCQTPSSSETDDSRDYSPARSNGPSLLVPKLKDNDSLQRDNRKTTHHILTKELKVVLTRLPASAIADALPQPQLQLQLQATPQKHCSEDESLSSAESDNLWEPEGDSSDSDFNISTFNTGSNKRRKINTKNGKYNWSHAAPQASTNSAETSTSTTSKSICAENNVAETSTSQASGSTDSKSNTTTTTTATTTTTPSQARTDSNANSQEKKTTTKVSVQSSTTIPVQSSTVAPLTCQPPTKTPPIVQQQEISVNMTVIAKKKTLCWNRGTVVELITKEDGRLKYKVNFEEKGKSLVSGHHMAFDKTPKLEQLYVGARVVVQCQENKYRFQPGVLGELPSRKNRLRFLVFMDDHTPVYVGLPFLHLVCRPLEDVVDDIPDSPYKCFLKQYLKDWPYPHLAHYRIGQNLNVELDGEQQRCEVQLVDSSLIQIVFQDNQRKEWIYRGSIRLEHVVWFLEQKERGEPKDDSD